MPDFDLPPVVAGHWNTADGQEMAARYAVMTRNQLASGQMSDMEAAFYIAMTMRDDLNHEGRLSVAKDRIRWLSVQLALRDAEIAALRAPKTLVIHMGGGLIEQVTAPEEIPGLKVVVIDSDTEGTSHDVYTYKGDEVVVSVETPTVYPISWDADFTDGDGEAVNPLVDDLDEVNERLQSVLGPARNLDDLTMEQLVDVFDRESRRAAREGWCLIESASRGLEIEADNDSGRFCHGGESHDDKAVGFVREQARTGSIFHRLAAEIHRCGRNQLRLEAEALGYHAYAVDEHWRYINAQTRQIQSGFATEEAAWTAAYMHAYDAGLLEDE